MRRVLVVVTVTLVTSALVAVESVTARAAKRAVPGVTKTAIKVGGLASPPNDTLNVSYPDGFDGVQAYFDKVNKAGGVFGRKFEMVAKLSDQGQPSANIRAVRSLVEEKKVFAVLPIMTNSFTLGGRYLQQKGVPSFGINVDPAWCGTSDEQAKIEQALLTQGQLLQCPRQNLFGEKGSFLCFECPGVGPSYIALQKGITKAAIFGYTHISSSKCVKGVTESFEKYGVQVVHENSSLQFGFAVSEVASDVQKMRDAGVQMVATCMEFGGGFKISQALRQAGVNNVVFYAPEGYKQSTLDKYGDQLNNFFFPVFVTPWQIKPLPKGTREFLAAMKKLGKEPNEHNQAGWINAALLVEGIKKAGKNFTQKSVVNAINRITNFTADGIRAGIDWTRSGHGPARQACAAFMEAVDGKFVPRWGKPGQPFTCFPANPLPPNLSDPYFLPLKPGETNPTAAAS